MHYGNTSIFDKGDKFVPFKDQFMTLVELRELWSKFDYLKPLAVKALKQKREIQR